MRVRACARARARAVSVILPSVHRGRARNTTAMTDLARAHRQRRDVVDRERAAAVERLLAREPPRGRDRYTHIYTALSGEVVVKGGSRLLS